MKGWQEPEPGIVTVTPGGADDPLGESVLDPNLPALRIFEPRDVRVVVGRHQRAEQEVLVEVVRADGVPVHRRHSGGGAVVLAPGMVVVALRLKQERIDVQATLCTVAKALAAVIATAGGPPLAVRGHGDLAVVDDRGQPRKVLGASIRARPGTCHWLGVLLVEDAVPLMERYLAYPGREPDYRAGRCHGDFCSHLAVQGVTVATLSEALRAQLPRRLQLPLA